MRRVAVVLPGRSYGPDLPALAIPISVARECGHDVTSVRYLDDPWPDWRRAEAGDWSEVLNVLEPQISPAIAGADEVVVIAKSMGTSIVNGVGSLFPQSTRAIWITPLFGDPDVRRGAVNLGWKCLSAFGTGDSAHDPAGQAEVTRACAGVELSLYRADHRLAVDGDDAATDAGFEMLGQHVRAFLTTN